MLMKFFSKILILLTVFSNYAQAADFTLQLVPKTASVTNSQITDVDVSKITGIQPVISAVSPIGTIIMYAGGTIPTGWKSTDGSSLLKSQYPALYAIIGDAYSVTGQDALHFNLPNTQGIFVRGAGTQILSTNSLSYSATLGGYQADATKKNGLGLNDPGHSHGLSQLVSNTNNFGRQAFYDRGNGGGSAGYSTDGAGTNVSINTGDSETRPANISVNYMIKVQ